MNIYIVNTFEGAKAFFFFHQANELVEKHKAMGLPAIMTTARLEPLGDLVDRYFDFRSYKHPNAQQAFNFAVEEMGETASALNQDPEWVRNNPDNHVSEEVGPEAGDVLMMLTKMLQEMGLQDPLYQMLSKMRAKGFTDAQATKEAESAVDP